MSVGYTIKIFIVDGDPEGLRTIEKSNWTGLGLICPRAIWKDARDWPDFSRTGIYLLVAERSDELPHLYIGESDSIKIRVDQHSSRDWQTLIAFVSKDENLNKAHARYLESRMIELAKIAKRSFLDNGNSGTPVRLSNADRAEAEGFLQEALRILPIMGIHAFTEPRSIPTSSMLHLSGPDCIAAGKEAAEGFLVVKGAVVRGKAAPSLRESDRRLRENLLELGVLASQSDEKWILQKDYMFSSPSAAAKAVMGRSVNGLTEWKDSSGRTLKDIRES